MERRRRCGFVLAGIGLMIMVALALSFFRRQPYAFLDRFHPQRIDLDSRRILSARTSRSQSYPHALILSFRPDQASAVLAAMRSEFSTDSGFVSRDVSKEFASAGPDDLTWEFALGSLPSPTSPAIATDASAYFAGPRAAVTEDYFVRGSAFNRRPDPARQACFILLVQPVGWVDRCLEAVRSTLHIPG